MYGDPGCVQIVLCVNLQIIAWQLCFLLSYFHAIEVEVHGPLGEKVSQPMWRHLTCPSYLRATGVDSIC